jgi:calcineurin-like phosphoesterase family protein
VILQTVAEGGLKKRSVSHTRRSAAVLLAAVVSVGHLLAQSQRLPNAAASVKFAVIGDNGTGDRPQYEVGAQMARAHASFAFDTVIMLGDNMYGSQEPADFVKKFEQPYKALLESGVQFFATLGNHDNQLNRYYKPFSMGGERYYSFAKKNVRFFVLDSDSLDPKQMAWLEESLKSSTDEWKICYFHHPLYSDGGTHGSAVELRVVLEPLFLRYGVGVVFSGHEHFYERLTPQKGIYYFIEGAGGQLRRGDIVRSEFKAAGFDQDQSFMLVEISGADLFFQTISRVGQIVDSGSIRRGGPRL